MVIQTTKHKHSTGQARRQRGQGMTEYIIIVALIAIAAIAVYSMFGSTVRNQVSGMAQELAGKDGTAAQKDAGKAADAATDSAKKRDKGGLGNYTGNNQ